MLDQASDKEMLQHKFLETRQHLMALQVKHMEARLAEAEEKKEEAMVRKQIAKVELEHIQERMEEAKIRKEIAKRELEMLDNS